VRMALVCGFFMQVAHKEGDKGNYLTVKDNQVRCNAEVWAWYSFDSGDRWWGYIRPAGWIHSQSG
jgi:hypothetical protein